MFPFPVDHFQVVGRQLKFFLCKNGGSSEVQNFRPISLLPVLSKVIDRHVHDSLYSYLLKSN